MFGEGPTNSLNSHLNGAEDRSDYCSDMGKNVPGPNKAAEGFWVI